MMQFMLFEMSTQLNRLDFTHTHAINWCTECTILSSHVFSMSEPLLASYPHIFESLKSTIITLEGKSNQEDATTSATKHTEESL